MSHQFTLWQPESRSEKGEKQKIQVNHTASYFENELLTSSLLNSTTLSPGDWIQLLVGGRIGFALDTSPGSVETRILFPIFSFLASCNFKLSSHIHTYVHIYTCLCICLYLLDTKQEREHMKKATIYQDTWVQPCLRRTLAALTWESRNIKLGG